MANIIINPGIISSKNTNTPTSLSSLIVYKDVSYESKTNSATNSYYIDKKINVAAVEAALKQCFTWRKNERVLLPEFGSELQKYLYEGITPATEEAVVASIQYTVSQWEPRVQIREIQNVSNISDTEDNTVVLRVIYTIPSLSTDQQFFYDLDTKTPIA